MADKVHVVVDVEADGPAPGPYSMVCFGAAVVEHNSRTFYGKVSPISEKWIPDALAISGFSREDHLKFPNPKFTMAEFSKWLSSLNAKRLVLVSDNNQFDGAFLNYYFHVYNGSNPFGFSSRRIGDFFAGLRMQWNDHNSWKKFRQTQHDHNPVNDALGNVEALLEIERQYNVRIL